MFNDLRILLSTYQCSNNLPLASFSIDSFYERSLRKPKIELGQQKLADHFSQNIFFIKVLLLFVNKIKALSDSKLNVDLNNIFFFNMLRFYKSEIICQKYGTTQKRCVQL
jgi:hypothetical protein